jgi:type IV fimbrial biogenesis protein FimT
MIKSSSSETVKAHRGFTLMEIMIVISIIAVLVTLAMPDLTTYVKNARINNVAGELSGDISLARQEAIRRGNRIIICASANGTTCLSGANIDWREGWIITSAAGQVLKANTDTAEVGSSVTARGVSPITFSPSGVLVIATGGVIPNVKVRDDRSGLAGLPTQRDVSLSLSGRANVLKVNG